MSLEVQADTTNQRAENQKFAGRATARATKVAKVTKGCKITKAFRSAGSAVLRFVLLPLPAEELTTLGFRMLPGFS